jgi:predicted SAM-dependent methyltransferase
MANNKSRIQELMIMSESSKYIKKLVISICQLFGIHIIRDRHSRWQLEMYPTIDRPSKPTYVNIGAGSFYHPQWHNMDIPNDFYRVQQGSNIHIKHDLNSDNSFPIESSSVEIYYTSHVIEHLSDCAVKRIFTEVHRTLVPGGVFRITCPDMELQYNAYLRNDQWFWPQPSPWGTTSNDIEQRFLEHFATILSSNFSEKFERKVTTPQLKDIFSKNLMEPFFILISDLLPQNANSILPEGHCNWFTGGKIARLLSESGFSCINPSNYLQSIDPRMRVSTLFDGTCPELSVYIECSK